MLKRPIVTEKSMRLADSGYYTFEVEKYATKQLIEKLVSSKFGVDVLSVKTINIPSKEKTQRTRKGYYRSGGIKKAIVQVKKGQKIALFETMMKPEQAQVTTADTLEKTQVKEKKSLLKGTKVRIEKEGK